MSHHQHENDPLYGWGPANSDPRDHTVPLDLERYYRNFKPGFWGYVCPSCGMVFPPGLAGMPGGFRAHIVDVAQGKGCMFAPAAPKVGHA